MNPHPSKNNGGGRNGNGRDRRLKASVLRRPRARFNHLFDTLTPRQKAFVLEYLSNGFNGTRAAAAAGLARTNNACAVGAWETLKVPKVRAVVDEALRSAGWTADMVLARIAEVANASPADFTDRRWRIKRSEVERRGHLIRKMRFPAKGRPGEIELHDGFAAVVHLGKAVGLFSDETRLSTGGAPLRLELSVAPKEITG